MSPRSHELSDKTNYGDQRYTGLLTQIRQNINDFKRQVTREINKNNPNVDHAIYMAWTKLKVLASISNVAFFELLTGTDIEDIDGFGEYAGGKRGGGGKENNIYSLIHDPNVFNITKFEVFIHCFLALGDKENARVFNPLLCNVFDDPQRVLNKDEEILLDYSKVENKVNNESCLKLAEIFEKYKLVEKFMEMENQEKAASSARLSVIQEVPEDSTPKSFEQPIVSRTTSMSSFVPTNITSEQEKFNSDFATIMDSFLEKGMDITQAQKQTVKSIRDMQMLTKSFTGQEESLTSAASKIVRGETQL